jgi:hypothetical protein
VKVGNRVTRRDAPEIVGSVISLHGAQARVYWSAHFLQLVDLAKLTLTARIHDRKTKGKHDV